MDKRSDQTKVYDFIRANPGATTKVIRKGAGVRNERVTDILAAGRASGELIMTAGFWGSRSYTLGTQKSEPEPPIQIPVPDQDTSSKIQVPEGWNEASAPLPVAQISVPVAQPVVPDLGLALLQPGHAYSGSPSPEPSPQPTPESLPDAEPWLVELTLACREAAERGIAHAVAQMAAQSQGLKTEEKAEPQKGTTDEAMRDWELRTRDRRPISPSTYVVR